MPITLMKCLILLCSTGNISRDLFSVVKFVGNILLNYYIGALPISDVRGSFLTPIQGSEGLTPNIIDNS